MFFSPFLFFLQKFMNLTVFNFDMCKCLTQIPNLSGLSNLKEPSFEYYENLITVTSQLIFWINFKYWVLLVAANLWVSTHQVMDWNRMNERTVTQSFYTNTVPHANENLARIRNRQIGFPWETIISRHCNI